MSNIGRKIKITKCLAVGKQFTNLIDDSEHIVVSAPKPYKSNSSGVWVMGVGERVKVLNSEFNFLD